MNAIFTRTAAPTFIAAFCLLATVAGCQSRTSTAEGPGMSQGPSSSLEQRISASSSTLGQGLTTVTLNDDSMNNMPATEVSVPKGWHVQGRMTMVPCSSLPSPTWMQARQMATARSTCCRPSGGNGERALRTEMVAFRLPDLSTPRIFCRSSPHVCTESTWSEQCP